MATKNIIHVSVESRFIAVSDHTQITAGNVGIDFLAVTLDAEWDGLNTYVTFAGCAQDPTTLDYAAELGVPWEQIEEAGDLFLGIQGFDPSADVSIDQEGQLVTNGAVPVLNAMAMTVPIKVRDSGAASGVAPTEPTPGTLQRVEQDLLALEKLTEGAGETIANAETAASNANAAASSANASKEAAQQAASDASSAAKAATAAAVKADTAAGNADSATAAASSATSAANTAAADATAAAEEANSAASSANSAAANASEKADAANTAANAANVATSAANTAAADATAAAEEARGAVSPEMVLYLTYDSIGGTDYLTLVDAEEA